jgi:molybdenum cofactor biosynthesis enzyme MoaA
MKITQRLFDHYGIDTHKDLKIRQKCPKPFDTVLIDKRGSCFACECTAWLPQSIGNLQVSELSDIIGSDMHQHLQSTIDDGTYRYCNQVQCTYLQSNDWPSGTPAAVEHLRLAIDDSCNLRCPTCRNDMIFHKQGLSYNLGIKLANKINRWLRDSDRPVQVHIGSDGDPFASHVYRHFMEQTPTRDNIKYSILTNGLMFGEFHNKIPQVINNLQELGVSIDGASEDTYERLRLGGRWDKIKSNLQSIADTKAKNNFTFRLHMVVQQDNWWEMPDMIRLAEQYNVDQVYFNKIQDWNTALDYSQQTFTELDQFKALVKEVNDRIEKFGTERKYLVKGFSLSQ